MSVILFDAEINYLTNKFKMFLNLSNFWCCKLFNFENRLVGHDLTPSHQNESRPYSNE